MKNENKTPENEGKEDSAMKADEYKLDTNDNRAIAKASYEETAEEINKLSEKKPPFVPNLDVDDLTLDEIENDGLTSPYSFCFLDRELSWLQFNLRVLNMAGSSKVPILERLKFLGIYYSNLDEFFMVRVGSLMHRTVLLPDYHDPKTGWDTSYQIKKIMQEAKKQQKKVEMIWDGLKNELNCFDLEVVDFNNISKTDEAVTKAYFSSIRPLIAPRIVDKIHPMPFIGGGESWIAVLLNGSKKQPLLGIVPLFRLPKFYVFEAEGKQKIVIISDMVRHYSRLLFKHFEVNESCTFRVVRNADVFINEMKDYSDFRENMEKVLKKRKREMPVVMQIEGDFGTKMEELLCSYISVPKKHIFLTKVPFNVDFSSVVNAPENSKYEERHSVRTVQLKKGQYFKYLNNNDILLSFPYQSITPFIEMLYEAADDPTVVSIRITLYRLAAGSKLVAALAYAAEHGKDVLCLLELRARFDEQNNIDYSKILEDAGCQVIYGLPDKKVHSKLCLITRVEEDRTSFITQIGTGNYNEATSEQYCDLSLITSDEAIGRETADVFDHLALGENPPKTENLITAPLGFKDMILENIEEQTKLGKDGSIAIKVNSINDIDVMTALIEASKNMVPVELFVRGICCLRPGIAGNTDSITVHSIVSRYLEHSRVFVFGKGDDAKIYIGSGDLLNRNTRRRVEAFAPIKDKKVRSQVLEVMDAYRCDNEFGSIMMADGTYITMPGGSGTSSQERLWNYFKNIIVEEPEEEKTKKGFFAWLRRFFSDKK